MKKPELDFHFRFRDFASREFLKRDSGLRIQLSKRSARSIIETANSF